MAPVYHALRRRRDAFRTLCCVTGQHRAMLDQALAAFAITPDFDLGLMRESPELSGLHAAIVAAMPRVFAAAQPDLVLVHGDTTSALATAIAAFHQRIPVGHVEAGLRSHTLSEPFPEELNRRAVGLIASLHFAPTEEAKGNLLREGCDGRSIHVTGNTAIDAVRIMGECGSGPRVAEALDRAIGCNHRDARLVVVTCHRRETIDAGLGALCGALMELAEAFPAVRFLLPVHPNPALRRGMASLLGSRDNLRPVDPLPYDVFLAAMRASLCLVTDSGGMQEEALAIGKPVLVMRAVTERPEAIAAGGARLVGTSQSGIVAAVSRLLTNDREREEMTAAHNPFGDGHAADRIAAVLAAW